MSTIEKLAKVCHEANRAYCETIEDFSQVPWDEAPAWQKNSAINGVKFFLHNPSVTAAEMHQSWVNKKLVEGWRYGPKKDAKKKEHPCMVPYSKLPEEQKIKDHLFSAIVAALTYDEE